MNLSWNKCQGDVWCKLNRVSLEHGHFENMEGVYIIWHGGTEPKVVYVGQGVIRDRLARHRQDEDVQRYSNLDLFVTWASVPINRRDGVESYLAGFWNPLVGDKHKTAIQILLKSILLGSDRTPTYRAMSNFGF